MLRQVSSKGRFLESNIKQFVYEQQRFRRYLRQRAPLWRPSSVQSLFNIPPRKVYLEEDEDMMDIEETIYENKFRSIVSYFNQEFTVPVMQGGSQKQLKEVEDEHRRLIEENKKENERIAKLREERIKDERKREDLLELKRKLVVNEEYLIKKEKAIQLIRREKERYQTYITQDKLKDAIETALDHPTSYDFAVDLNGTIVFDRKLHPYALNPSAEPDSSDVIGDYIDENSTIQLDSKKLFH